MSINNLFLSFTTISGLFSLTVHPGKSQRNLACYPSVCIYWQIPHDNLRLPQLQPQGDTCIIRQ